MVMSQDQNLLTTGSIVKKMLLFAVPIFFSNLFQQLYNAVDSLIVGNFIGEEALAAVGSSGSLIMLMIGFINGVSMGAGVLIARFFRGSRMMRTSKERFIQQWHSVWYPVLC